MKINFRHCDSLILDIKFVPEDHDYEHDDNDCHDARHDTGGNVDAVGGLGPGRVAITDPGQYLLDVGVVAVSDDVQQLLGVAVHGISDWGRGSGGERGQ